MLFPRASGILLHPTCLPGRYGIGDLGAMAYRFVDYLHSAGQSYWQVLPLGPTSYGDSPYQTLSSLAGNPLLISFDQLAADGWLDHSDLEHVPEFSDFKVMYGEVISYHDHILNIAFQKFKQRADASIKAAFEAWCAANAWVYDFGLFASLKTQHALRAWVEWSPELAQPSPARVTELRAQFAEAIENQCFRQWQFHKQWFALKDYAHSKGIRFIGDIPIYVAHDSSDVWANRHLFKLRANGQPNVVAGVPPDYFSADGQLWGNPHYRWDLMEADGFKWWIQRVEQTLALVDIARIDHFIGFIKYYEIPFGAETARSGELKLDGPGEALFKTFQAKFGAELPIIAEDLGELIPQVAALRDHFNLPGMKVLQFAFGGDQYSVNDFLPHTYHPNCVVYSGTHDNNTTLGWWQTGEASEGMRRHLQAYIGHEVREPHWDLIRLGMNSVAHTFVAPLQDVLGFGADTRMNTPGKPAGNWTWRFGAKWLDHSSRERLLEHTKLGGRLPAQNQPNHA